MPQSPEKLPPLDNGQDQPSRKLTQEELAKLGDRLSTNALSTKNDSVKRSEDKVYRHQQPVYISRAEMEKSASRQVNEEMDRRKKSREALEAKHHKPNPTKKMSSDEVQESVRRVYDDQVRIKKERLAKAQDARDKQLKLERGGADAPPERRLNRDEMSDMGARLAKPSKRQFTEDEMNAIIFK